MDEWSGRWYRLLMGLVKKRRRRALKRHVQTDFLTKDGAKPRFTRGGKRRGAGRPPKGKRAGSAHKRRPAFRASQPLHVVLRVTPELGNLRRRSLYRALRTASIVAARRDDVRIVHLSIQRTHVHLIVEANHRTALATGMKAFQISAAKHLNRAVSRGGERRRRGQVFTDRYHAEIITSPRQARRALAYVLNNWRKHHEDRGARAWPVDPFSTGDRFAGWRELAAPWRWPTTYEPLVVWEPQTWLLTTGWRKHGLVSTREVPSAPPIRA